MSFPSLLVPPSLCMSMLVSTWWFLLSSHPIIFTWSSSIIWRGRVRVRLTIRSVWVWISVWWGIWIRRIMTSPPLSSVLTHLPMFFSFYAFFWLSSLDTASFVSLCFFPFFLSVDKSKFSYLKGIKENHFYKLHSRYQLKNYNIYGQLSIQQWNNMILTT